MINRYWSQENNVIYRKVNRTFDVREVHLGYSKGNFIVVAYYDNNRISFMSYNHYVVTVFRTEGKATLKQIDEIKDRNGCYDAPYGHYELYIPDTMSFNGMTANHTEYGMKPILSEDVESTIF